MHTHLLCRQVIILSFNHLIMMVRQIEFKKWRNWNVVCTHLLCRQASTSIRPLSSWILDLNSPSLPKNHQHHQGNSASAPSPPSLSFRRSSFIFAPAPYLTLHRIANSIDHRSVNATNLNDLFRSSSSTSEIQIEKVRERFPWFFCANLGKPHYD